MRLYTSKVIADWLGLTERRVRQLRDEGIIEEQAPGLYDLRATTRRYISYLRSGSLADERAGGLDPRQAGGGGDGKRAAAR